ncbi:MAG TPA: PAS domain-containing protein [Kofleriaceae bacterium]|nr:PAS domain-containing protein [Kofleriaceae bacterium]
MLTLDDLDDSALDQLPFGVVCLDEHLKVVRMNKTESDASGIQRWRAMGREFFRDVAPGPTNRELADAVRAFADGSGPRAVSHVFHRRAGDDATQIELVHGRDAAVYLCIRR